MGKTPGQKLFVLQDCICARIIHESRTIHSQCVQSGLELSNAQGPGKPLGSKSLERIVGYGEK